MVIAAGLAVFVYLSVPTAGTAGDYRLVGYGENSAVAHSRDQHGDDVSNAAHTCAAGDRDGHGDCVSAVAKSHHHDFTISGDLAGLYPGLGTVLVLNVSNPQHFDILVQTLTVTVQDAAAGCLAGNLSIGGYTGAPILVPAGRTVQQQLPALLLHSAPDGCQGVSFPLVYSGTAGKAVHAPPRAHESDSG